MPLNRFYFGKTEGFPLVVHPEMSVSVGLIAKRFSCRLGLWCSTFSESQAFTRNVFFWIVDPFDLATNTTFAPLFCPEDLLSLAQV